MMNNTEIILSPTPLNIEECQALATCEATIAAGFNTFIDVGMALAIIQEKRLYRESYATFEGYVEKRWNKGRAWAYRLIIATEVAQQMSPIGDIGSGLKEAHMRELAAIDGVPERVAALSIANDIASKPGNPTALDVKAAVDTIREAISHRGNVGGEDNTPLVEHAREVRDTSKKQRKSILSCKAVVTAMDGLTITLKLDADPINVGLGQFVFVVLYDAPERAI